ncbi:oligosaccharide repeat unit polymerase [Pseudorhodoferax sp. Leaf267]|uniref:oligosaccharide repeat unit polymerase n=1 Tax=Pseudorhodoferax sp. Leaf267 TaxID=1736316 RepID=UPI000A9D0136|nr:oligosaccharide repeat unit polymerase [Pseudorhodoferax sp. Leaf267]
MHRAAHLWWLHPGRMVMLGLMPLYLAIASFDFARVVKNVYVPSAMYLFGVVLIAAMGLGIAAATVHAPPRAVPRDPPMVSTGTMLMLLALTMMAYVVWLGPVAMRPSLLVEIWRGQRAELRDDLSTSPGLTTLTQLGVAYVIAYAIKCGAGIQRVSMAERVGFWLVMLLAVLRAFAWAERLAVLELLVCWVVARLAYLPIHSASGWRMASVAPAFAPVAVYLAFTASEYFRSWEYYVDQYDSIWGFTLDRLLTYYATAVNNGVGLLADLTGWPFFEGGYLFKWLHRTPVLGDLFTASLGNTRPIDNDWLARFARPEFNSPSAYFRFVLDVGFLGSVLFVLLLGWLIGRAWIGFRLGYRSGLLTYPMWVLFLLESIRYNYLAESRFVPLALGLVILALDMRRQDALRQMGGPASAAVGAR